MTETFYEVMRRQGITRRSYLKFCSLTAASLGLGPAFAPFIAHALETKPRTPVLWLHGLECTCCTESFICSVHRAEAGYCLEKVGCKGPTPYNACSTTRWIEGLADTDRKYLRFGTAFEHTLVNQSEPRTLEQSMQLGWGLLAEFANSELTRLSDAQIAAHIERAP